MEARRAQGLVGRDDALARVAAAVAAAPDGQGAALLVTGTAGMGKTALLRTALASVQRVHLAWGTCVEAGSAPGYWPWTQALNGLVRSVGVDTARSAAGGDASLLAGLASALGDGPAPEESERNRLLLLDAALAWLRALADAAPLVVVLDDLQWVDDSSLRLLELVVDDPRPTPLSVLGAYRDDEVPHRLRARLAALAARTDHVHLEGLDRPAVARLVEAAAARPVPDATVEVIHARAGGHPFFTRELAFAAADGVSLERVPAAVHAAVQRRVRALPAATQQVLRAAALAGSWLLPDVLGAATSRAPGEVAAAAEAAVEAGMVVPDAGRLRFAHDLFREAVADGIDGQLRAPLHLALGEALVARDRRGAAVPAAEVARHFRLALPVGGLQRAVDWAMRAAEQDRAALALAEAADHLRRLRAAVADAGLALTDSQLVDVLLAESAALAVAGRGSDARGLLRVAREAGQRTGDVAQRARVALAVAATGSRFAVRRDDVVEELRSALDAAREADPAVEAALTAALARALQHSVPEQRAQAGPLSERALRLGRASGDPAVLADCLLARHDVLWRTGGAAARVELTAELVALARDSGDRDRHAQALLLQANALLETGSAAFAPALEQSLELLQERASPQDRYTVQTRRAFLALLRGDTNAVELVEQAAELGRRVREPDTDNVRMSQRLELVRAGAVPEELLAFADEAVAHWTGAPVHAHAVAAGFSARAGDLAAARRHTAAVHDLGTWRADRSYLWSVFVRELAEAAIALQDRALCAELLEELLPHAGSCGVNGALIAFAGCHSHTAGRLAAALGETSRAQSLLAEAAQTYERLGAAELRRLREQTSHATGQAVLRRRGTLWEVQYGGQTATVRHCKGLQDVAVLLSSPGRDVHVLDLVQAPAAAQGSGPVLDRAASASYRRRLAELAEERARAEALRDAARLAAVEDEHDALLRELRSGTGLGGRAREFAHPAERARKAVAGRIRDAVRRVEEVLPELAAHLDRTLVTGVRCRYRGDQRWEVAW